MSRSVDRIADTLPAMQQQIKTACDAANEAREHSILLRSRHEDFGKRLDCIDKNLANGSNLAQQINTSVAVLDSTVDRLGKETDTIKNSKSKSLTIALTTAISIGMALSAWSWSLSGDVATTRQAIAGESAVREAEFTALRQDVEALPQRADMQKIQRTLDDNGHGSHETACSRLTEKQKTSIQQQIMRGSLPPSFGCD